MWFYSNDVSVNNGETTVNINDGYDTSNLVRSDAIFINNIGPLEILDKAAGQVILKSPWSDVTVTNGSCFVLPTSGDFQEASAAIRAATVLTTSNIEALSTYVTGTGTIDFVHPDTLETVTVKTPRELENEAQVNVEGAAGSATAASVSAALAETHKNTVSTLKDQVVSNAAVVASDTIEVANNTVTVSNDKDATVAAKDDAQAAKVAAEAARDIAVTAQLGADKALRIYMKDLAPKEINVIIGVGLSFFLKDGTSSPINLEAS